jgi:hypothetical protein
LYDFDGETVMPDSSIEEVFVKLKLLKVFDFYKTRSLTIEQQSWLETVCDEYLTTSSRERTAINSLVTPEISFLFFMYANAMATESVELNDEAKVLRGLVSLSVENRTFDWRDSLLQLSLLYHSASKVGADAAELLQRVAAISSSRTSEGFLQFLATSPEHKEIANFGWKEGRDTTGRFCYVAK